MTMSSVMTTSKPPQEISAPKKNKKKANRAVGCNSLTAMSEIVLPKLDGMVLLQPIGASSDGESPTTDRTRFNNVRLELDKYNQCVPFANTPNIDSYLQDAATGMQRAVHNIDSTISEIMIKLDENILDLQKQTRMFTDAVNLFNLSNKKLDTALTKHPRRGTEFQLKYLKSIIRNARDICPDSFGRRRIVRRTPEKVTRPIQEIQTCPNGNYEAFQPCIYATAHLFLWNDTIAHIDWGGSKADTKEVESLVMTIIRDSRNTSRLDATHQPIAFFDFAAARRDVWKSVSPRCSSCRQPRDNDWFGLFFDSSTPCPRTSILKLLAILQIQAYNEIKSGIMLTLPSKLPKELCLLIFEHALVSQEIPLDPSVFKAKEGDSVTRLREQAWLRFRKKSTFVRRRGIEQKHRMIQID